MLFFFLAIIKKQLLKLCELFQDEKVTLFLKKSVMQTISLSTSDIKL